MNTNEILKYLKDKTGVQREQTCDTVLSGNGEKEIKKLATCFKASAFVISKAIETGCDLLICHEPLYFGDESGNTDDPVYKAKKQLLEKSGLVVCRFHDYAHEQQPDYIHAGFLKTTGIEIDDSVFYERESLGIRRYKLKNPLSLEEIVSIIKDKINIPYVRVAGCKDITVKVMMLGLGAVGAAQFMALNRTDADVFITGECGEVYSMEYMRDGAFFGKQKAALMLGHYGSEHEGMRLLADTISREISLPCEYIDGGETFEAL